MSIGLRVFCCAVALCISSTAASAVTMTAGPGGFDDGYATRITYDDAAARGTANNRSDPLNALGAPDGDFFEIGLGSSIELTFGTLFDTSLTVFEITFGNVLNWPEQVLLEVGLNGNFVQIGGPISNVVAQSGVTVGLGTGTFDTVRLIDDTPTLLSILNVNPPSTGGFDIDAVKVSPAGLSNVAAVPLPATGLLLLAALGAGALVGRRKTKS